MFMLVFFMLISCISNRALEARTRLPQHEYKHGLVPSHMAQEPVFQPSAYLESFLSANKQKVHSSAPKQQTNQITKVPVEIDTPGYYTVENDLVASEAGFAILVTGKDVYIDFKSHTLILSADSTGIAIYASNVTINNPAITTIDTFNTEGIYVLYSSNVLLKNIQIWRNEPSAKETDKAACTIRGNCDRVTLEAPEISGYSHAIVVQDSSHIAINNGSLQSLKRSLEADDVSDMTVTGTTLESDKTAAYVTSSTSVSFNSCSFLKAIYGIWAKQVTWLSLENVTMHVDWAVHGESLVNTTINNSRFQGDVDPFGIQIWGSGSNGLTVTNSSFDGYARALYPSGLNNVIVQKSTFSGLTGDGLSIDGGEGILIEDCIFNAAPENNYYMLMLYCCRSAIVRDCTFTATKSHPAMDGLRLEGTQTTTLQNLLVDINPTGTDEVPFPAGICIQSFANHPSASGIKVSNCIVCNAKVNILSDATDPSAPHKNIVFDNCVVDGGETGIMLSNTHSSAIKNCSINNVSGNGITIAQSIHGTDGLSVANSISKCTIIDNGKDGIYVDPQADKTLIADNSVFNNGGAGIATNAQSQVVNNITFANGADQKM